MSRREQRRAKRRGPTTRVPGRLPERALPASGQPDGSAAGDAPRASRPRLVAGIAVVATVGAVYVATAARDIVAGDSPEFVMVGLIGGVAHAPGYPLLALIGHLFAVMPVDPAPFRENLVSVVCHALTAGVVYMTALRLVRHAGAAAVAALALAFGPLFWAWSLVAETFPLNDLLAALLVYLVLCWYDEPVRWRVLVAAAFVLGLGAANHQTIVFALPGVAYLVWRRRAALPRAPRPWLALVGAGALGVSPYLYVFWAAAQHPYWNWGGVSSLGDLVALILRTGYGTAQLADPTFQGGSALGRELGFLASYSAVEGALVLAGAYAAYRSARHYFWATLLSWLVAGPAFIAYTNVDWSQAIVRTFLPRFFLLAHVISAPLAAFGVVLIVDLAARRSPRARSWISRGVSTVAAAAAIALVPLGFAAVDQRENTALRRYGEDVLATLEPGAVFIVAGDPQVLSVSYLQGVEGRRRDVAIVVSPLLPLDWYLRELHASRSELALPFTVHRDRSVTLSSLADLNRSRAVQIQAPLWDDTLNERYWLYRRGLVLRVEPLPIQIGVDTVGEINDGLLRTYRPPLPSEIKGEFERAILNDYAFVSYDVGHQFEALKDYPLARQWYERALATYPDQPEAKAALAKLPR